MAKRGVHKAPAVQLRDQAVDPATCGARLPLEISERVFDRRLVRDDELTRHVGIGNAEDDGDALRAFNVS
jgi:hypothetical protein